MDNDKLKVLVFGAGAIGTYIGGSLALRGHRVVFLERPQVVEQLLRSGLHLEIAGEQFHIANPTMAVSIEQAVTAGPFDLGIFALKSFDTQTVLDSIQPWSDRLPPILCLQNGVDNEAAIRAALGTDKVIAGTVTSAVGRRNAGNIVLERLRGVGISAGHPISNRLAQSMQAAGLEARQYDKPAEMKWSKLLTNLIANASSAILDMAPGEIFAHPGLYCLEIAQLREALAVMRSLGIAVVDLPGTPVRLLALSVRLLPAALSQPLLSRAVGGGRGGKMPSFYIDLHNGRGKSEVGYINGAVARYGAQTGLATPVNHLLNDILQALTQGESKLSEFAGQPDKLLSRLNLKSSPASTRRPDR